MTQTVPAAAAPAAAAAAAHVQLWGASVIEPGPGTPPLPPGPRKVEPPWLVTTQVIDDGTANDWTEHSHHEHELLWSTTGNVTVEVAGHVWLVPPALGIWIPAGTRHRARARAGASTFVTYVDPERAGVGLGGTGGTGSADGSGGLDGLDKVMGISVSAALRELILHNRLAQMSPERRERMQRTIVDLLVPVRTASLDVPLPRSAELLGIARRIIASPADGRTVDAWAATISVSGRTLMRRFEAETGLTLARWRNLVRVRVALVDIAAGMTVASVARRLGYSSPSAFITLFRSVTGRTPAEYFRSVESA